MGWSPLIQHHQEYQEGLQDQDRLLPPENALTDWHATATLHDQEVPPGDGPQKPGVAPLIGCES